MGLPAPQFSPRIQHSYLEARAPGTVPSAVFRDALELLRDLRHMFHKLRKLQRQAQIPAVAHARHGLLHDRAAAFDPDRRRFTHRVSSIIEHIREEIRIKPCLRLLDRDVRYHPRGHSVAGRSHHRVQSDLREVLPVRLGPGPVVSQEHDRLFPIRMRQFHALLRKPRHKLHVVFHPVQILPRRILKRRVVSSVVYEVLRPHLIPVFPREFLQRIRRHRRHIPKPVHRTLFP